MISPRIIKIASFTKSSGLKNEFTHKSKIKNSVCGDAITIELLVKKNRIISMRYETESCVLCEASTSLLSRKIKNFNFLETKKLEDLKKLLKKRSIKLPHKFSEYKYLIQKGNLGRINCVILPIDGLLKAIRMSK